MWYVSTRGMAPRIDFEGALFSGYAPDGGLYMPEELPQLGRETLHEWSTLSYPSLVKELCSLSIAPELIPRDDLNGEHPSTFLLSHLTILPAQTPELQSHHLTHGRAPFFPKFGFPGGSNDKESACTVGDPGLIPGLGRSPGEGTGYPLQDSCLRSLVGYSPRGHKESDITK